MTHAKKTLLIELKNFNFFHEEIIPEVLDTVCGKCLPVHIEKVKETLEYICLHRRADLEEVKAKMDPTGELEAKFVAKYGDLSCKH